MGGAGSLEYVCGNGWVRVKVGGRSGGAVKVGAKKRGAAGERVIRPRR